MSNNLFKRVKNVTNGHHWRRQNEQSGLNDVEDSTKLSLFTVAAWQLTADSGSCRAKLGQPLKADMLHGPSSTSLVSCLQGSISNTAANLGFIALFPSQTVQAWEMMTDRHHNRSVFGALVRADNIADSPVSATYYWLRWNSTINCSVDGFFLPSRLSNYIMSQKLHS